MDKIELLENQIKVLSNRIKILENEDRKKSGALDFLIKGLNKTNNEANLLRKKLKSEINRVMSRIK